MSLLVAATNSSAEEKEPPWLLVDTEKLTLKVMRGKRAEVVFNNISVGQNGVGKAKQRGDKTTPLGRFNIGWINPESRYHLFFGLTYPSLERAELGFENGTIDLDVYIAIRMAESRRLQ